MSSTPEPRVSALGAVRRAGWFPGLSRSDGGAEPTCLGRVAPGSRWSVGLEGVGADHLAPVGVSLDAAGGLDLRGSEDSRRGLRGRQ